mgnify:CR=1 FL=1
MSLKLSSTAFGHQGRIPSLYTCDGHDLSPPLSWTGMPPATRSLALLVVDPDAPDPLAPKTTWVHWVLYNLPADCTGLPEAVSRADLPPGTREGVNDWRRTGYGGPCPPSGTHGYVFRLSALNVALRLPGGASRAQVEQAMEGHVLAWTQMVGTFRR